MASPNIITEADFDRLLELESNRNPEDGWEMMKKVDNAEVWIKRGKRSCDTHPLTRGYLEFPGMKKDHLIRLVGDIKLRQSYDNTYKTFQLVEEYDHHRICYAEVNITAPFVSNRDFVTCQALKDTGKEVVIYNKSTTHPDWPEKSGIVRGEIITNGRIIREKEGDPDSCTMTTFLQLDYKGYLPTAVVTSKQVESSANAAQKIQNFYNSKFKAMMESEAAEQ